MTPNLPSNGFISFAYVICFDTLLRTQLISASPNQHAGGTLTMDKGPVMYISYHLGLLAGWQVHFTWTIYSGGHIWNCFVLNGSWQSWIGYIMIDSVRYLHGHYDTAPLIIFFPELTFFFHSWSYLCIRSYNRVVHDIAGIPYKVGIPINQSYKHKVCIITVWSTQRMIFITSQLSLGAGHCQWDRLTDRNICN